MCNHKSRPVVSPVAGDCVVELVGLEPTTRVLWNIVVSDQLPWSDTPPDRRRNANASWPSFSLLSLKRLRTGLGPKVRGIKLRSAGILQFGGWFFAQMKFSTQSVTIFFMHSLASQ